MREVNVLIIAYEKITIRIQIIAFFIDDVGVFPDSNTESIYLYHAYIINIAQTTNHSWLKNWTTKTK